MGWEKNREQYESREHYGEQFRKFSDEPLMTQLDMFPRFRTSKKMQDVSPLPIILGTIAVLLLFFIIKPFRMDSVVGVAIAVILITGGISGTALYITHRNRSDSKAAAEEIMARYEKEKQQQKNRY